MDSSSPAASSSSPSASWFSGLVGGRSFKTSAAGSAASNLAIPGPGGDGAGPANRKNQLPGALFKYGTKSVQVAFKTGDFNQQVIFIGGLTDGLLATEYLEPLAIALENVKWSLVQPLFSSSYIGYGTSSLEQDSLELDQLIGYLINKRNSEGVVLLGHSTGCQDIVNYMRTNFPCSRAVRGVILQAPVSDREYRATLPETAAMIDLAANLISEGRPMDLMPREADTCAPITAYSILKIIFSMADEYVPEFVDKKALVERLSKAMGGAEAVEIEWGNHSLSNRVEEAVQAIVDFVKREGPKGWDDPWN